MSSKRAFFVMSGCLALTCVLFISAILLGNRMLQKKSARLLALKVDNRTLDEQQKSLLQAKKDIEKYEELNRIAKTIVPQEKDQARTVREIVSIAESSGIKISNITFPSSNLGQAQVKPVAPKEGETPTPTPAAPPLTQVKPVENIKGLYQLEINIQSDSGAPIPYAKLIDFLTRLERNRRTAQVTSITVQPSSTSRGLITFSVVINVYIKP